MRRPLVAGVLVIMLALGLAGLGLSGATAAARRTVRFPAP